MKIYTYVDDIGFELISNNVRERRLRWTHRESEAPGKSFNRMHSNNDWHCLHSFYSFPNELPYYYESQVSSHYPYSFHYCGKVISSVIYPRPTFCRLESWYRPLIFFIKTTFPLLLLQQYYLDSLLPQTGLKTHKLLFIFSRVLCLSWRPQS